MKKKKRRKRIKRKRKEDNEQGKEEATFKSAFGRGNNIQGSGEM